MNAIRKWLFKFLLVEIARARVLKPDDLIFIRFSSELNMAQQTEQFDHIQKKFPDNTVVALSPA